MGKLYVSSLARTGCATTAFICLQDGGEVYSDEGLCSLTSLGTSVAAWSFSGILVSSALWRFAFAVPAAFLARK